jgi:aspartate kinase
MKVFKFGGASVKDAAAVKNVAAILEHYRKEQLIVVVSAMGKTTNALEKVVNASIQQAPNLNELIAEVRDFHLRIINDLGFPANHSIHDKLNNCFVEIDWNTEGETDKGYNFVYDQIVSMGELLATQIVSDYLALNGRANTWLDVRDVLITDNTYREGKVDWATTEELIRKKTPSLLAASTLVITQGFIGATTENYTTTLGREGSDYTAAIFSYCLKASEMVVWKDVPGVLSADPKYYDDAVKLEQISYRDAIELTYYGATVIHPKTIKPLENRQIPMRVASFIAPGDKGTLIGDFQATKPLVPCLIFKPNQILFSISAKDFSFIAEDSISIIFSLFVKHHVKVNLMQNSAISFSVCIDNDPMKIPALTRELSAAYNVRYNENLRLITIRHYFSSTVEQLTKGKEILLEQRSRQTAQLIIRED